MVIQDSVTTASTPPAIDSREIRVRSRASAAIRYTTGSAGSAMNPSSILVLNASPNATALRISQSSGRRQAGPQRLEQRPRAHREQQRQHRVGVVVPVDRHHHRGQRKDERGDQRRRVGAALPGQAGDAAPHRGVHHGDGGDAFGRLRQQQAPAVESEHARGDPHDPERERRLVDRDERGGIQRTVEERLPALRPAQHRGGVKRVRIPVTGQVPRVQDRGQHQHGPQPGPRPAGIRRPAEH